MKKGHKNGPNPFSMSLVFYTKKKKYLESISKIAIDGLNITTHGETERHL